MLSDKSSKPVAVVTGANRGIGLETVRQLAQRDIRVILTSRNAAKGEMALEKLLTEGLDVLFQPLDVASENSVAELGAFIHSRCGRVDILVNNAGIFLDRHGTEEADASGATSVLTASLNTLTLTLKTNLYGPMLLAQELTPLMKQQHYGRIVNVSSGMGQLSDMEGGSPAYRISKTALNALTRILAAETKGYNILVNSVCPGWVRTEMGGPNAERPVEQGAAGIVWAATLPDDGPTGGVFRDGQPIAW
ncbi:MAG: SDR family oxidoreductase [Synechococcaceae cyanobacterium SM1_2_3]|nr:SDR family oxidoreductase [Synechococcaceae cyanobacterium SM1_2_3]